MLSLELFVFCGEFDEVPPSKSVSDFNVLSSWMLTDELVVVGFCELGGGITSDDIGFLSTSIY